MSKNKDTDSNDTNPTETHSITRRRFLQATGAAGVMYWLGPTLMIGGKAYAAIPGGNLDLTTVPKFVTPLLIPPVMPKAGVVRTRGGKNIDYYEISVRQFPQQILPEKDIDGNSLGMTMVWGYGAVAAADKKGQQYVNFHHAPSLTIEAMRDTPIRIKWINDLKDADGNYLPHLLPVDPTLHWANPPGGIAGRDTRPDYIGVGTPDRYTGPVPIVTHLHGAVGVGEESDGYPEAWYLPAASNIDSTYATEGTWYSDFKGKAEDNYADTTYNWGPGYAIFQYPNENRASTIWYHDHSLGITRLNVYAGPAGFYLLRGKGNGVIDSRTGLTGVLPGPAPKDGEPYPSNKTYYEIPIVIQDRSFNDDGSLFYPDSREFFDGFPGPYIGETALLLDGSTGQSDVSPIWNPEFFGNTMMVNGNTWPFLEVEQRRYRLRFLNGCQSRFLILDFSQIQGVEVWQIGNDGGYLDPAKDQQLGNGPVNLTATNGNRLLLALAERADLIIDFTNVPIGGYVLGNVGPDEPFGGGTPGLDFDVADTATTGQVMEFRVVPAVALDPSTPPQFLQLPALTPLPQPIVTRPLALAEAGSIVTDGPAEALLGIVTGDPNVGTGVWASLLWMEAVTEDPVVGTTEIWEIYNTTVDAHPIHVHETVFEVVNRQGISVNADTLEVQVPATILDAAGVSVPNVPVPAETWEAGFKDTVVAYPGQVTRIKVQFNTIGRFVWHCHILEHEDNEMMRPFNIKELPPA